MIPKPEKGSIRIIAGQWRSRRLPVPEIPGLRPSGDRSRETLFNWLQAFLPGSICVDLFAGTGALGFEAASRGAASVVMVEKDARAVRHLCKSAELLKSEQVEIFHGDALSWLEEQGEGSIGILFVDPPFRDHLHQEVLNKIDQSNCLAPGGLVYVESPASQPAPHGSAEWSTWREKVIGDVRMQVFRRYSEGEPAR